MTDNKKFLIISLVTNFLYVIIGLVLMLLNNLNTVSIILFSAIVVVCVVSCVLSWKIMHDQNRGRNQ